MQEKQRRVLKYKEPRNRNDVDEEELPTNECSVAVAKQLNNGGRRVCGCLLTTKVRREREGETGWAVSEEVVILGDVYIYSLYQLPAALHCHDRANSMEPHNWKSRKDRMHGH